ncbi:MAG: hypothetical protein A2Y82_04465 [Candidatus Buchananbacteria bacterium RBG_13_36_9]|uniref:Uncharacterized protein n=1 Tax=Candidatus Buchananbacteria bacterium RBG_13_36_9 TaxID=1797530 RepID=A0A1G1XRY2_9BACT|nr:MAG: hypothetical protein A2Y82_04465 [Candidatus Buchananbacteria bacterium RBG_13_36_9]
MEKKLAHNLILTVTIIVLAYILSHQVKAGLVSGFSDQLSSQVIASASNHTINFKNSSDFGPNKTLEIYFEQDFDLGLINYTDIDLLDDGSNKNLAATPGSGVGSNIGVSISGQTITFTQNDTDTIAAGSAITIKIGSIAEHQTEGDQQIYNPETAETYKISISGSFGDMGTISVQILESDMVGLKAKIEPELSFYMRNSDDSGVFSNCSLGIVSQSSVSECSFRLAGETNAVNGFQIWISSDGDLRNDSDSIAKITENTQVVAGTESYGLAITAGNNITEAGDFTDDDTPILSTNTLLISTNSVYNYIQGNLATSSEVTLKVSVSSQTAAGSYRQLLYFSIIGNY